VWFRYPTKRDQWVLKGLNFTIKRGEKVAFIGESGSGKSTILSLLLRFYEPNEGRILVNKKNITNYSIFQLRKAMGLVMQEPVLFNEDIAYNIGYGNPAATSQDIIEAAKNANAYNFILEMQKEDFHEGELPQ